MKNLPEHQMEELKNRLRNYAEQPDDAAWEKIAVALPVSSPVSWVKPLVLGSVFLLYTTGVWLAGRYSYSDVSFLSAEDKKSNVAIAADSIHVKLADHEMTKKELLLSAESKGDSVISATHSRTLSKNQSTAAGPAVTKPYRMEETDRGSLRSVYDQSLFTVEAAGSRLATIDSLEEKVFERRDSTLEKSSRSEDPVIIQKPKKVRTRPVLYLQIAPSLSYQKIIPFHDDNTYITKLNPKSIFSGDRVGFNADAGLQWRLAERLDLYTGISYHQESGVMSFTYQSGDTDAGESQGSGFNYVLTPKANTGSLKYDMKNFGASAGVLYLLQATGLRHKIGVGLQYQAGLSSGSKDAGYQNSGSLYLNYQIIYRVEFPINPHYTFFIQPAFTHSILVKEKFDAPFDIKHYNAALGLGMVYKF